MNVGTLSAITKKRPIEENIVRADTRVFTMISSFQNRRQPYDKELLSILVA